MTAPASWITIVGQSDYYWRVTGPAKAIGAKTILLPQQPEINAEDPRRGVSALYSIMMPNNDTLFRWEMDADAASDYVSYPDVEGSAVVWTRPDLWRATHGRAMREQLGLRTVAETDDNYLSNSKFNIYMKSNGFDKTTREQHLKAMASHESVVFSTHWLRDTYWKAWRELYGRDWRALAPEVHVVGNHVFAEDWPEREEYDGPVRVGWMGSPSHLWDVDLIWPALMAVKQAGAEPVMMGYDPTDPPHAVYSQRSFDKIKQWRKVGHTMVPWRDLSWYERMSIPFDIGLAPLLYNDFTLGKSDVKAVEYAIAGVAPILQNHPVYNRDWKHEETCLLAGSPSEFIDCTLRLIRDKPLREEIVANAQEYVRENRNLWDRAWEWEEAVLGFVPAEPVSQMMKVAA